MAQSYAGKLRTGDVGRLLETRQDCGAARNLLRACLPLPVGQCLPEQVQGWVLG